MLSSNCPLVLRTPSSHTIVFDSKLTIFWLKIWFSLFWWPVPLFLTISYLFCRPYEGLAFVYVLFWIEKLVLIFVLINIQFCEPFPLKTVSHESRSAFQSFTTQWKRSSICHDSCISLTNSKSLNTGLCGVSWLLSDCCLTCRPFSFKLWNVLFVLVRLGSITLSVLTFWYGLATSQSTQLDVAIGNFNTQVIRYSISSYIWKVLTLSFDNSFEILTEINQKLVIILVFNGLLPHLKCFKGLEKCFHKLIVCICV